MHLPPDAKARKATPIYSGVVKYFPKALAAVAELSRKGNEQHNPGQPLHWDRTKSTDELDALMRHLVDAGTVDTDDVRHSTKVAWRALANLEKELEAAEGSSVEANAEPELYVPKAGDTVRVVAIDPYDDCPDHHVGDVIGVFQACPKGSGEPWILINNGRSPTNDVYHTGTYCRVVPA